MTDMLENLTFDELAVGQGGSLSRTLTAADIHDFARVSGDVNPAHLDAAYAAATPFKVVIGHGMWSGALISCLLGTRFPGPGTIYLEQTLKFHRPVHVGDTVTVTLTVLEKEERRKKVVLDCQVANQDGVVVVSGQATVMAPTVKVVIPRPEL
ncbi:acyl dehydratase [Fluviicoccus keumensis]|uniref:Acyl dehydratase n=1 Tax=Fluviicoccus keumensis TaxID=1435465 RepID=A0A4Q7Z8I3_9GAMM|nr:MaoC/PaaZ C-terminal domain-containing protein [Fluviicoccus keumensis]RZU46790.1 acyl dehydratase [Fluviicoccus keumensis]